MLSMNNGGLGGRSDSFSVFAPYRGRLVAEQDSACCVAQELAKVQIPKSGLSFQSIAEPLPSVPE